MNAPRNQNELFELLDALLGDTIAPPEHERLEKLLAADPVARRVYFDYLDLHLQLRRWQKAEAASQKREGGRETGGEGQQIRDSEIEIQDWLARNLEPRIPPIVLDLPSTSHYPLSTIHSFVGSWAFSYMVATVILGMMLLGAWAYKITHYQQIAEAPPGVVPSNARPELVFVGRITGMVDCRWADPSTAAFPGASVPLDRKYALASGLMQITYDSGAKVILEGPCTYEVESRTGGYISLGKLTARVETDKQTRRQGDKERMAGDTSPRSLSPCLLVSPSFSVRTPTAVVTDLGTEFGVEVSDKGNTTSYVFVGSVKVQVVDGNGKRKEMVLRENESARVEKNDNAGGPRLVLGGEVGDLPKFARRLAKPISFSGSYDGSYDPSIATPPPGQSTWTKVTTGACAVAPNDDNGTSTSGTANFNDLDMAGRIQVSRSMGAGTFSTIQAYDEYVYIARIKFYGADAYNGSDFGAVAERATVALGFRDEYNGTTKGKAVFLGWFLKKADDGNKPGLWLVNGHHTDTGVKLNNVDYFDDAWHAYRVEKFVDTDGVAKVKVFVDGVQVGSTVNYSSLPAPHPKLNDQGFGWFSNSTHAVRATVDFIEYGGIPEPSASAEKRSRISVEGGPPPRQSREQ